MLDLKLVTSRSSNRYLDLLNNGHDSQFSSVAKIGELLVFYQEVRVLKIPRLLFVHQPSSLNKGIYIDLKKRLLSS